MDLSVKLSSLQKTVKQTVFSELQAPPAGPFEVPSNHPRSNIKPKGGQKGVLTHQGAKEGLPPAEPATSSKTTPDADSEAEEQEEESENENPAPAPEETEYKKLKFKALKDLNSAVKNYGPTAPFTVSMLEALSGGGYLIPAEWYKVTRAVLTRGQFLSWKAEFVDRCQTIARKKQKNPGDPASAWTLDKLSGQGRYVAEGRQHKFPTGLLAQVAEAAWRLAGYSLQGVCNYALD